MFRIWRVHGTDCGLLTEWVWYWRDEDRDIGAGPFASEAQALHDHLITLMGEMIQRINFNAE